MREIAILLSSPVLVVSFFLYPRSKEDFKVCKKSTVVGCCWRRISREKRSFLGSEKHKECPLGKSVLSSLRLSLSLFPWRSNQQIYRLKGNLKAAKKKEGGGDESKDTHVAAVNDYHNKIHVVSESLQESCRRPEEEEEEATNSFDNDGF